MQTEIEKIERNAFEAYAFHVDFKNDLALGVLGNHLLNCSNLHASKRGFGIDNLNVNQTTWVLSRLSIEMNRYPKKGEKFNIDTWITDIYRLFTDRCYAIESTEGEVLGYGKSVWAMIDMDTRKPLDLEASYGNRIDEIVADKACPIQKSNRIKVKNGTLAHKHTVVYGDIDMNGHLNSVKYIEHALNTFTLPYLSSHFLRRFEIAYVAESYFGDTISIYKEEVEDNVYHIEIRKNDKEVVTRCRLAFDAT
jgi:acyl-ACP thioesterase